jgi:hypothetical protein
MTTDGGVDETMQRALSMAMHGVSVEEIASELGASSVDEAHQWISEASRRAREQSAAAMPAGPNPVHTPRSQDRAARREDATALLDPRQGLGPLIEVESDDPPNGWTAEIWMCDLLASTFEDRVDEMIQFVVSLPGIVNVLHEDRELVLVSGEVEPVRLRSDVTDWWVQVLSAEAES